MKTRVLLLIYHLSDGGAERGVSLWAKMLADANYDVTILTYYPRPDEYKVDSRITRASLFSSFEAYQQQPDKTLACKKLLEQYLIEHPQDILIPSLIDLIPAICDQTNLKVTTHTILDSPWDNETGLKLAIRDWSIQKQGSVILQNDEQAVYFNSHLFKHVKKYIVHNALNPDILKIKKENYHSIKKIIAVGRLATQKNHALMIEIIRILRDEYHEKYYLDIYGEGDLKDTLQAQIDKYHLNDQVKLCGRSMDIFHILINYDLFLITSIHEGTPNALLEAMGLGVPSLAVKCRTGIIELINDNKNGYIVDSYDPHTIAEKIHSINNAQKLQQIGIQARLDMINRFTVDKIQAELVHVIEDLLANPPKTSKAILPPCRIQTFSDYQNFFHYSLYIPYQGAHKLSICQLLTPVDYKNYFDYSLYALRNVDYKFGKQIFEQARRTLLKLGNQQFDVSNGNIKLYLICLRRNQFNVIYNFFRNEHI